MSVCSNASRKRRNRCETHSGRRTAPFRNIERNVRTGGSYGNPTASVKPEWTRGRESPITFTIALAPDFGSIFISNRSTAADSRAD
jgi:hypothetical protein